MDYSPKIHLDILRNDDTGMAHSSFVRAYPALRDLAHRRTRLFPGFERVVLVASDTPVAKPSALAGVDEDSLSVTG